MFKRIIIFGLSLLILTSFFPITAQAKNAPPGPFNLKNPIVECSNEQSTVSLDWSNSKNSSYYVVERQSEGSNLWDLISPNINSNITNFTDNLGSLTGNFSYRVKAVNNSRVRFSNSVNINVVGCLVTPPPPPPDPEPEPNSVVWGSYNGNTINSLVDFENHIGQKENINAIFVGWGDPFPIEMANYLKDLNQTLLIYWEAIGYNYNDLLSGNSDSYISSFGSEARAFGGNVILVPFPEMNGDWTSWGGTVGPNTPDQFAPMWRHVHNVFGESSNVKWGWAVNDSSVPNTQENQIEVYYPGDAYVDYVGVDGFNFGEPWLTFDQLFSSSLSKLKNYNKPIYIFSMACAEDSQKANWISDALSKIYSPEYGISGFIWFNANKEENWLIWSNPDSLNAFQSGIQ